MKNDLPQRVVINGLGTLFIILIIYLANVGPFSWVFPTAVAAIAGIAVWEYYGLVKKKGLSPAVTLGVIFSIAYVFVMFLKTAGPYQIADSWWQNAPEIILALAFFGNFLYFAIRGGEPIVNISTSFLGVVYIGIPLALVVRIMYFFSYQGGADPYLEGTWWIIYLILVTKFADMGGYFVGRKFGKHKLAIKLSPNKTLEGALGGLVASMLVSLVICFLGRSWGSVFGGFTYPMAIGLGLLVGCVGQIGDLAESFLKRDAGVKDSNVLPAVGGILDMVDSLLFSTPVVYIFLRIFYT